MIDERLGADEAFRRIAGLAGGDPDDARVVEEAPSGFFEVLAQARSGADSPSAEEIALAEQTVRRSDVCAGSAEVLAVHAQVALCR